MPLPDERPRQSVANLIGRFEQQTKRTSLPGNGPLPGSLKALEMGADSTAGASKFEPKEKREWPPKPASDSTLSIVQAAPIAQQASVQGRVTNTISSTPPPKSANSSVSDVPFPTGKTSESAAKPAKTTTSSKSADHAASRPSSTKQAEVAKGSIPRASLPTSQPLKAQHTGHAAASQSSARKTPVPKPSVPTTTKTSPSRSKTPISSRTKSPLANTSRPKTPSSGLYAPTAASLARSKNAAAATSPPVRKVASTSSDRLSKPTASSLSKARSSASPPPSSTPSRTSTKTPVGRPSTAHRTHQSRPSTAAAKDRASKTSTDSESLVGAATVIVAGTATVVATAVSHSEDEPEIPEKVTPTEEIVTGAEAPEADEPSSEIAQSSLALNQVVSAPPAFEIAEAATVPSEDEAVSQEVSQEVAEHREASPEPEATDLLESVPADDTPLHQTEEHESDATLAESSWSQIDTDIPGKAASVEEEEATELGHTETYPGDDLDEIVNLLEAKPRPFVVTPVPDDVADIPDEE